MIPKIIHYCWFNDPPEYPEDVLKCMESWKRILPDYEIKWWNASNIDLSSCKYAQEAYQEKKYAFASDYVRLRALYDYGGIYLDADVEVLKSFNDLLHNKAFTCFEDEHRIAAFVLGSEKENPLFKELIEDYKDRKFILEGGIYDHTPNSVPVANRLIKHGLKTDGTYQVLDHITVYPMEYFCPFNPFRKGEDCFTENTYANHHFNAGWHNEYEKLIKKKKQEFAEKYGADKYGMHFKIWQMTHALFYSIKLLGLKKTVVRIRWKVKKRLTNDLLKNP